MIAGASFRRLFAASSIAFLIALILALYSSSAYADTAGFKPVSPDELKMTSEPNAPGAPAVILYREVYRDDNLRTGHEDNYYRIKILTQEGRKYADIEIPVDKGNRDVGGIKARTIRPDGTIANFDGKVFEKTVVKAKGVKRLVKTFTLPDVQVGSIIEYYYTILFKEYTIWNSNWILSEELFTKSAKFSLKPYVNSDDPYYLRWSWRLLPAGTAAPKEGPDHIYRMETSNIPAFPTEDFMPPENELKSRVDFIYDEDYPEPNLEKFWKQKNKKMNGKMEGFVGKRKVMEEAVSQIVSPNDSPEEKLKKIYARVQQLRNTSYEVQKTEQEEKRANEKVIKNVEDIWKQGYGTDVQLTWLYLALVRAAGIEAYGEWVPNRSYYFFNPKTMDNSKLNSNVVVVKLNGKDIFCDPGTAFTPFGLLPWFETGVQGLRMDKEGGTWLMTPLPEGAVSRIERKASLTLSETGDLGGKLTVTFTGLEASRRRVEERNEDETARKKYLEDEVKGYIPAASELELTNKPDWGSSEPPLVAEFTLKVSGWASGAGRRILVPVGLFSAAEKHVFDHATRVHPVYFEFPYERVDDVTIEPPLGWRATNLPPAQKQDAKIVLYTMKVENDKSTLHLTRDFRIDSSMFDAKYYAGIREFFQLARAGDEQQIMLQP